MKKSKSVHAVASDLQQASEFLHKYYYIKEYYVKRIHRENVYYFVMTKDNLYRRMIGRVPVIAVKWEYCDPLVNITVAAYMEHGRDTTKAIRKLLQLPELGFEKMVANALAAPKFGKAFCDEALSMSECMLASSPI